MSGSAPTTVLVLFVAFLVAMPLVALIAGRLRLPYTVALVLVGLVVSALPIHESVQLSPGLAVTVLLPGLVFEAAYRLDGDELRRTFGGVALLAVPGVLVTAAVVALVLHHRHRTAAQRGLPRRRDRVGDRSGRRRQHDAPAVGASAPRDAPRRGEPVQRRHGRTRVRRRPRRARGAAADARRGRGPVHGRPAGQRRHRRSVGVPHLARAEDDERPPDRAHADGARGVRDVSRRRPLPRVGDHRERRRGDRPRDVRAREGLSRRAQEAIDVVWEFLAFILTGAAFLLIGFAIPLDTLAAAAVSIAWGVVAVLIGRAIVVYGLLGGAARLDHRIRRVPSLPLSWLHVMNWTGLRGAVATALALSIPEGTPDRELLQGIAFGVVLFTLIVQGTTAERMLRWAGVHGAGKGRTGAVVLEA